MPGCGSSRLPGRSQQMGVVVRALRRVPLLPVRGGERGDEVAFLGVNSNDGEDSAAEFLAEFPVPYPSYVDLDLKIADAIEGRSGVPRDRVLRRRGSLAYVETARTRTPTSSPPTSSDTRGSG